jgi:dephospho-CoA kinase
VGLTGGIGSGKSEVSRLLAERGAVVIDLDVLAREVVAPGTPGYQRVVAEFGPSAVGADGALDRPALGRLVFADAERLRALEAIVHPLVRARTAELVAAAPPDAVVVHDVPLLVEKHMRDLYDVVVVVDVPVEAQLDRLVRLRGMREADARARIAAQASREQRLAVADEIVDNSGTLADLADQVQVLWGHLKRRVAAR